MKRSNMHSLFQLLKVEPRERDLYQQALTHSSYAHEHKLGNGAHNERLEFLGDAVLELTVSEELYRRFPNLPEGKLTRFRAVLVCEDALFKMANMLSLGTYLRLGKGEAASGGRQRPSLLADAFEAMLGALYLDLGFQQVKTVVNRLFAPMFLDLEQGSLYNDYKTLMQEYSQAVFSKTPEYRIVSESGPDHDKVFMAQVLIDEKIVGVGSGRSKKDAEQEAARLAYQKYEKL